MEINIPNVTNKTIVDCSLSLFSVIYDGIVEISLNTPKISVQSRPKSLYLFTSNLLYVFTNLEMLIEKKGH